MSACSYIKLILLWIIFCFFNRSISRTELQKKMDEDFILKITNSGIFYKDYCNKKKSLKYLIYKSDIKNNKYVNLKEEQNTTFNRFLNDLDENAKEELRLKKQLAFICFRKKDGSLYMDNVYKKQIYQKKSILKIKYLNYY